MAANLTQNANGVTTFQSSVNSNTVLFLDDVRGAYVNHDKYVQFFDDFLGDALDARWNGTGGANAPAAAPAVAAAKNGIVRLTSGDATGTAANEGSTLAQELTWYANSGGLYMRTRVRINTSVASVAVNIGFTDTKAIEEPISLSGTTLTTTATDAAVFLFDTDATNDYWHLQGVKNDVDTALLNTSVGPSADTWTTLELAIDSSGNAQFWIDGVLRGAVANAVTPTVALSPVFHIQPRTTTSKVLDVDYVFIACTRA